MNFLSCVALDKMTHFLLPFLLQLPGLGSQGTFKQLLGFQGAIKQPPSPPSRTSQLTQQCTWETFESSKSLLQSTHENPSCTTLGRKRASN
ncbi:hypothetical protein HUJ04_012092 [Dendroctonus ponderosae]|nr:hypothetical protein HUJ04_012092 [Dendroctonus ponderosae]KAH1029207.1 hypothetical protein HUJ05_002486 [Dendroctonus ponderosae]